ncbi:aldehyde dehydrogenase [Ancylobacter defluvii]|uniref:Aldehyde dehydrogenase n=2 Tax=Ancylobacter defluvii TaxID=1282440 RepID=A0A9W6JWC5_9HYPH|nr:aldehyde dehydrogenase [Ancylobacter defluvii]
MCSMSEEDQFYTKPTSVPLSGSEALARRSVLQMAGAATATVAIPNAFAHAHTSSASAPAATDVISLHFKVNSAEQRLAVDPRQSLLDVLRERLDLTGTKKGCNTGACGACTVHVNGQRIVSCLTLAAMHEGAEITTIEGIAKGNELHPLQAAFIEHDGLQCGYCTPGQIMSGVACISEGHAGTPEEIQRWMSGNICRCGAYPGIVAAISETAKRG